MRHPTDDEIMRALCCGVECAVGSKNTGCFHRWDFTSEAARIRALLDQHGRCRRAWTGQASRKKRSNLEARPRRRFQTELSAVEPLLSYPPTMIMRRPSGFRRTMLPSKVTQP